MSTSDLLATDRGPARHFHGRQDILTAFSKQLRLAVSENFRENGTIFLIQGSPGAGKTALLYKCSELAEGGGTEVGRQKWRVVDIDYSALYNPAALMRQTDKTYTYGKTTEMSGQVEVSVPGFGGGGAEFRRTHQSADDDMMEILNKLARKEPLLLVLDEVQEISKYLFPEELKVLTKTLVRIHNGKTRHPVVLLCGGLGTSSEIFESLGISRFRKNCMVHLGRLSEVNERAVIRDWLVKDGGAREEDIVPWIEVIARETHGWPQHIMVYVDPAATLLEAQNGRVTQESLHMVLQEGLAGKQEYYHARSGMLSDLEVDALAMVLYNAPVSGGLKQSVILQGLMNIGDMTSKKAEAVFRKALHKGVLSNAGTGSPRRYAVPIPSMKSYLFEEAGIMVPSREGNKEN